MIKENQFCFIELSWEFVAFPSEINSAQSFILERVLLSVAFDGEFLHIRFDRCARDFPSLFSYFKRWYREKLWKNFPECLFFTEKTENELRAMSPIENRLNQQWKWYCRTFPTLRSEDFPQLRFIAPVLVHGKESTRMWCGKSEKYTLKILCTCSWKECEAH